MVLLCLFSFSQNIEDPYFEFTTSPLIWSDDPLNDEFTGEYRIFTDKLFWNKDVWGLATSAISLKIEIVSFPFVPKEIESCYLIHSRELSTDIVNDATHYGLLELKYNGQTYHKGKGWIYEGFKIFQRSDNCRECPNDNTNI